LSLLRTRVGKLFLLGSLSGLLHYIGPFSIPVPP
jgi:hypothetical protein